MWKKLENEYFSNTGNMEIASHLGKTLNMMSKLKTKYFQLRAELLHLMMASICQ